MSAMKEPASTPSLDLVPIELDLMPHRAVHGHLRPFVVGDGRYDALVWGCRGARGRTQLLGQARVLRTAGAGARRQ